MSLRTTSLGRPRPHPVGLGQQAGQRGPGEGGGQLRVGKGPFLGDGNVSNWTEVVSAQGCLSSQPLTCSA